MMGNAALREADGCAQIAAALQAEKLILMTDVPGVLRDKNDVSTKFAELSIRQTRNLVAEGVIAGGMIPKCALLIMQASCMQQHPTIKMRLESLGLHVIFSSMRLECARAQARPFGAAEAMRFDLKKAQVPCMLSACVLKACAGVQGGVLRAVPGAGRARHAHHRRPPGALAAAGAAHRRGRWHYACGLSAPG